MLKPKNDLTHANTVSAASSEDLFLEYLSSMSVEDDPQLLRKHYGKLKLEAAKNVTRLIEKNRLAVEGEQSKLASEEGESSILDIPLKTEEHLSTVESPSSSLPSEKNSADEKLKQFLDTVAVARRKNELIFGRKAGDSSQVSNSWGIEASPTIGCYRKNIDSTITREKAGWAEFAISYDNKIFLNATQKKAIGGHSFEFDHQTMWCGTFLKALGRIKINSNYLTISPFSSYFEVGFDQLPIILFVLQEKGVPISAQTVAIADEQGKIVSPFPHDLLAGEEDPIADFLNENRFPLAKAIAEDKKLSVEKRLRELFLDIDDKLLSTRNRALILRLLDKRIDLKTDIINFLLSLLATHLKEFKDEKQTLEEKDALEEDNATLEAEVDDKLADNESLGEEGYAKISNQLQAFQQQGIDLQFVKNEIFSWFYYISTLYFQAEASLQREPDVEKEALTSFLELKAIEASLQEIKEKSLSSSFAQRPILEQDGSISPLVKFYTNDPKETLIKVLMPNYTKGSAFKRLITFAWRRHHVERVNQFLLRYDNGLFSDNLTINGIFQFIYETQHHISERPDIKGLLIRYIKFCAKLNNEMDDGVKLDLTAISSLATETIQQQREVIKAATVSVMPVVPECTPLVAEGSAVAASASAMAATVQYPPLFGLPANLASIVREPITIDTSLERGLVKQVASSDKDSITSDSKASAKLFKASSQESLSQENQESLNISPVPSPS